MRPRLSTALAAYCVLIFAGGISYVLPEAIETPIESSASAGQITLQQPSSDRPMVIRIARTSPKDQSSASPQNPMRQEF